MPSQQQLSSEVGNEAVIKSVLTLCLTLREGMEAVPLARHCCVHRIPLLTPNHSNPGASCLPWGFLLFYGASCFSWSKALLLEMAAAEGSLVFSCRSIPCHPPPHTAPPAHRGSEPPTAPRTCSCSSPRVLCSLCRRGCDRAPRHGLGPAGERRGAAAQGRDALGERPEGVGQVRGSGAVHGEGTAGRAGVGSRVRTAPQGSAPSPGDVSGEE